MSPILVRPVREQLEHDRIIRLLPGKYRRRFEVGINPGAEQNAAVGTGPKAAFPDAILYSTERSRRVLGVVEVETGESINHLEAMAQWAAWARLRVLFHLYVPVGSVDIARRLSSDYQIDVTEIWTYDNIGDQVRFTLVQKAPEPAKSASHKAPAGSRPRSAKSPAARAAGPARTPTPKGQPAPKAASTRAVAAKGRSASVPRRASGAKAARPSAKPAPRRAKPVASKKPAPRKATAVKRR